MNFLYLFWCQALNTYNKLCNLAEIAEKIEQAEGEDKSKLENELNELNDLLPELQEKINDAKESALEKDAKLKVGETLAELAEAPKKATFEDSKSLAANPACDITNLVRKSTKRTVEASGDHEVKKIKFADETENHGTEPQ